MSSCRFLCHDGVVLRSSEAPCVSKFLESHTGAYTTTRTINNAANFLFWERHMRRLAASVRILLNSKPELLFKSGLSRFSVSQHVSDTSLHSLVDDSMSEALKLVLQESSRNDGEEFAVTVLVSGDRDKLSRTNNGNGERSALGFLDLWLHIGLYTPCPFGVRENAARLALVGSGRDVAAAKYSDWVRLRKPLERLRPPSATEILLSNDGDHLLEGCITNFFVVRPKGPEKFYHACGNSDSCKFEVQTAAITDGVLPGVIRQLVIEVCLSNGIPVREIAPSWCEHELWEEAFITSSLRVLQHVEMIAVPIAPWKTLASKRRGEIQWKEKRFREGPGMITQIIQKEIMEKAKQEGCPLSRF